MAVGTAVDSAAGSDREADGSVDTALDCLSVLAVGEWVNGVLYGPLAFSCTDCYGDQN